MFLGIPMFGYASLGSFLDGEKILSIFVFVPIFLLSVYSFISSLYKVKVTDTEIHVTKHLQSKCLQWSEIANISPKRDGYGFYLSNHNDNTKLFISNQLVDFKELVEQIERKRPDLFK